MYIQVFCLLDQHKMVHICEVKEKYMILYAFI